METINNSNNTNIELANKSQQFQKIKKILKTALKRINNKINKKSKIEAAEYSPEVDDNNFNEMLERRMEAYQNLANEQIIGQQEQIISYSFVENEHGKFYWSSDINRFVSVDNDLITSQLCTSTNQQPQVQCC